jgi:uncharacterized protein (TIGR02453 family)
MTDSLTFTADSTAFFTALKADNTKTFWDANKSRFESQVRLPLTVMADLLAPRWGTFKFMRMNRDIRFSKDKSPYKIMCGGASHRPGGTVLYLHLWEQSLMAVGGHYIMATDQTDRLRAAIADARGAVLTDIIASLTSAGFTVSGGGEAALKTAPRGYPKDHPRADLLRWKALMVETEDPSPAGATVEQQAARIDAFWTAATPLLDWLDTHVGPSRLPPR